MASVIAPSGSGVQTLSVPVQPADWRGQDRLPYQGIGDRPVAIGRRPRVPAFASRICILLAVLAGIYFARRCKRDTPDRELEEIAELPAQREHLADEQAALRRVATLVAQGAPPLTVFATVAEEVGRVLSVDRAYVGRFEGGKTVTHLATWSSAGETLPVQTRMPAGTGSVSGLVRDTGRPARIDRYSGDMYSIARTHGIGSAVGVPITVEGSPWGLIGVASTGDQPPSSDIESRLAGFTELVAIAIANAQAHEDLRAVADVQAALRRVATMVAKGAPPEQVFAAVTEEVGIVLGVSHSYMGRYDPDGALTALGMWRSPSSPSLPPVGSRVELGGRNVVTQVFKTGRLARVDHYEADTTGAAGDLGRTIGHGSAIGAPINIQGRLWGVMAVACMEDASLSDTEEQLEIFAELVATAIANSEARASLNESRARIVVAADEARRRIERDLHDGAQQSLVLAAMKLKAAEQASRDGAENVTHLIHEVAGSIDRATEELVRLARGIHPAALTTNGLPAALKTLARRSPIPVVLDVHTPTRLPEPIEATAYFVISEALTNAAKYSRGSEVTISVTAVDRGLRLSVDDDGIGGADPANGSGLVGLKDRIEAVGGTLTVQSVSGVGTHLAVELPLMESY
jgi:signal transduction histidine kinase